MKKLLILLFTLLISFNSYGGLFDKTVCVETETVERGGLIYLPNKDKPFTGKNLCKYDTGQYKSKGNIKNGIKDWKWTYWFENGQIKHPDCRVVSFKPYPKKNVPDYYMEVSADKVQIPNNIDWKFTNIDLLSLPNESKLFTGITICKSRNAEYTSKIKDGRPLLQIVTFLHENGNKMWNFTYSFPDQSRVGKGFVWHENGQIAAEENYKDRDGRRDGKTTEWDKTGRIISESMWKDEECISGDCPE